MNGFIYWLEYVPNPWVRGSAIAIMGALAYFYRDTSTPPDSAWIGPWGVCTEENGKMYEAAPLTVDERLFHTLVNTLGPVAGHLAFREAIRSLGHTVSDEAVVGYLQRRSAANTGHGNKKDA